MKTKNFNYLILILSIAAAQLAGVIGSFFTFPNISAWYITLSKPTFSPPDWLFGPVWVLLYTLMGVAAWLVWKNRQKKNISEALALYGIQLALNTLWSIIFFGWHNVGLALVETAVLWLMILATILLFHRVSRVAAYLMLPYLVLVAFAVLLNWSLWRLN